MNLCRRLVGVKPYLNHRNFSLILQSEFKSNNPTTPKQIEPFEISDAREIKQVRELPCVLTYTYQFSEDDSVDEMTEKFIAMNEIGMEISPHLYALLLTSLTKEGRRIDFIIASQVCRMCISKPWFKQFFKDNTLIMNTLLGGVGASSFDEFKKLVQALKNQGLQPNVFFYYQAIDEVCDFEKPALALEYFDTLSSSGMKFNSATYRSLFRKLRTENDLSVFRRLYQDALHKKVQLHSDCFETMIEVLMEKGDFQTAVSVWKHYCTDKSLNKPFVDFCSEILYNFCEAHKVDEAKALFKWMLLEEDMTPNEYATQELIGLYCLFKCVEDVKYIFDLIFRKGIYNVEINCSGWVASMWNVRDLIVKVGDSEIAKEASEYMITGYEYEDIPCLRKIICSFSGIQLDVSKED